MPHGSRPSHVLWTFHFLSVRASCCCKPDSPSEGGLLQCLAVSSVCPLPNQVVFSYGSLIFRFDSESSISLQVSQDLCLGYRDFVPVRVLLSENALMALFVSFTRYKWFNAAVSSGALALAASSVRNLATPFTVAPALNEWSRRGRVLVLAPLGVQNSFLFKSAFQTSLPPPTV